MKRMISVLLSFLMALCVSSATYAAVSDDGDATQVVENAVSAIDRHDWDTFINLQCLDNQNDFKAFLKSDANRSNYLGLFNIKSAKIKETKQLPIQSVGMYTDISSYEEKYQGLKVYLIGIDYDVFEENQYYFEGVNYRLVVVGKENSDWRIVEAQDAPIESLIPAGYGFGSRDEQKSLKIEYAKRNGLFIDSKGNTIKTNSSKLTSKANTISSYSVPYTIRVYRVSQQVTQEINFEYYCKNVLPNEWISSWPAESLKAGAEAVKMYGWYHVLHPKWPGLNADVKDTTADQVYKYGTATTATTNAVNNVNGVGLQNSSGNIFEAQYLAGNSGSAGTQHSGKMSQYGTKYLAQNGKNYLYMCHYYYDYSDKSSGTIVTFSY